MKMRTAILHEFIKLNDFFMRIGLIFLKINSDGQWHVGLAHIAAILKREGFEVRLYELEKMEELPAMIAEMKNFNPQVIGVSANSHQFFYVPEVTQKIKEVLSAPVFVGGVHTTICPQSVEVVKSIDGICVGEGEWPFLKLVEKIKNNENYFDTPNFWFRDGEKIIKNLPEALETNLDSFPFPDRSFFGYFNIDAKRKIVPRFIFSRGCPFECTYCCNHLFRKTYEGLGSYLRWRGVDSSLAEIEAEMSRYNFSHFKLDDDTFSLNKQWMAEFCDKLIAKKWNLTFECNVRPGTLDEDGMKKLKAARCTMIKIGIEAGNPELRKTILKRNFSNEDIVNTFDLAKKYGVRTFSFNMLGVPGETAATIQDTIELNRRIRPDVMQVTTFYPYEHTELGEMCFKNGYVEKTHEDHYMEKSILKLPTISARAVEAAVKNFKFNVYWGYDKRRAMKEKTEQMKASLLANPIIYRAAKRAYGIWKRKK
jgi:radical SAM superfamily enzyme YgiQ (UPF0313 family)